MFLINNEAVIIKEHLGVLRFRTRIPGIFEYSFSKEVRLSLKNLSISQGFSTVFLADKRNQLLYLVYAQQREEHRTIYVRELMVPKISDAWLDICHTSNVVAVRTSASKLTVFEWGITQDFQPVLKRTCVVVASHLHAPGYALPYGLVPMDETPQGHLFSCNDQVHLIQMVQYKHIEGNGDHEGFHMYQNGRFGERRAATAASIIDKPTDEDDPVSVYTVFQLNASGDEYALIPTVSFSSRTPLLLVYSAAMDPSSLVDASPSTLALRNQFVLLRFIFDSYIVDLNCMTYKLNKYFVQDIKQRIGRIFGNDKRQGMPFIISRNEVLFSDFSRHELYRDLPSSSVYIDPKFIDEGQAARLPDDPDQSNPLFGSRTWAMRVAKPTDALKDDFNYPSEKAPVPAVPRTSLPASSVYTGGGGIHHDGSMNLPSVTPIMQSIRRSREDSLAMTASPRYGHNTLKEPIDPGAHAVNAHVLNALTALEGRIGALTDENQALRHLLRQELSSFRQAYDATSQRLAQLETLVIANCKALGIQPPQQEYMTPAFAHIADVYQPTTSYTLSEPIINKETTMEALLLELNLVRTDIQQLSKRIPADQAIRLMGLQLPQAGDLTTARRRSTINSNMLPMPPRPKSASVSQQPTLSTVIRPVAPSTGLQKPTQNPRAPEPMKPPKKVQTPEEFSQCVEEFLRTYPEKRGDDSSSSLFTDLGYKLNSLYDALKGDVSTTSEKPTEAFLESDMLHAYTKKPSDMLQLDPPASSEALLGSYLDVAAFLRQFFALYLVDLVCENTEIIGLSVLTYPFMEIIKQAVNTATVCRRAVYEEAMDDVTPATAFEQERQSLRDLMCDEDGDSEYLEKVDSKLIDHTLLQFLRANPFVRALSAENLIALLKVFQQQLATRWNKLLAKCLVRYLKAPYHRAFKRLLIAPGPEYGVLFDVPSTCETVDASWLICVCCGILMLHGLVPVVDRSEYSDSASGLLWRTWTGEPISLHSR
ncbi:hypothetical protein GMRT_12808 [Giardia muris]|uniref:Uncharacterized protein n=1 Tax=Giardia muris TaxID=5742 RepID=A0A4Z1SN01_GIAMU|nr:hypothetical protein GMRT_12808 [Giardia muris]|eukprot:TNJ27112.1 hypothetical protein GMRT_12808 [Giardia muris]